MQRRGRWAVGPEYAAQGNILVSAETVEALAETFEATAGEPLVERLGTTQPSKQSSETSGGGADPEP